MFSVHVLFYFLLIFINIKFSSQQQTKIWVPNSNYDNPYNWLGHKLPCESSSIVFPENLNAAVYLPSNLKVKNVHLPNDGELVLQPSKGCLELTGNDPYPACNEQVVRFKRINIEPWLRPSNWKIQDSNSVNNAIPHLEKVPCRYDNVIFPKGSSFWVQYPEVPLSVNSFNIEGENLTDHQLQQFLYSEPGSRQFKNLDYQQRSNVISVRNDECTDKSGCICHESSDSVLFSVCHHLKHLCNVTHCLSPVKPVGHCCEICGSFLLFKFESNHFNLVKFKQNINQFMRDSGYTSLNTHISKVSYNQGTRIQIVVVEKDNNYRGESVSAATVLHNTLMSNLKKYNLLASELKIAGPEYWPETHFKTSMGIVFGSLLMVIVTLGIVYYISYRPPKENKFSLPFSLPSFSNFNPFLFVRFENSGDTEGGGLEFRNRSVASSLFNLDRAFDNPMYGEDSSAMPSTSQNTNETGANEAEKFEYKNPLYSELQKQDLSDEE